MINVFVGVGWRLLSLPAPDRSDGCSDTRPPAFTPCHSRGPTSLTHTHKRTQSVTVTGPEASHCWDDTLNLAPFFLEHPRTIRPAWANTQPFVKRLSGVDSEETDPVRRTDSVHTHATACIHLPLNLSFCCRRIGEMRRAERRG